MEQEALTQNMTGCGIGIYIIIHNICMISNTLYIQFNLKLGQSTVLANAKTVTSKRTLTPGLNIKGYILTA